MKIELTCRDLSKFSLDFRNINPDIVRGKTVDEIAALQLYSGNRSLDLGSLFEITVTEPHPTHSGGNIRPELILSGDLSRVDNIGYKMNAGVIIVNSGAGNHLGCQMTGGEIRVEGNVGDRAGAEMKNGVLRISGNAGDHAGAALAGSSSGMRGGLILVEQNAGDATGATMRRGLIAVGGNAGRLAGWNMRAGTILLAGSCATDVGTNMRRGTIVCGGLESQPNAERAPGRNPGPNFVSGEIYHPEFLSLVGSWLKRNSFAGADRLFGDCEFQSYFGDCNRGGKGELFVAV